jgi:hypothetical protein
LNLDMVGGIYVDPRVTFTRAGGRTFFGREMVKAEENLLLQSQTFETASWTKNNVTVTANSAVAPDGTTTADKIAETSATATHNVAQVVTLLALPYTRSVFLKAAERAFALVSDGTNHAVSVNLTTGAATLATGSPTGITSVESPVGSGWWRVSWTYTAAAGGQSLNIYSSADGVWANRSFAGVDGSGILAWGDQIEQRSFATAYTPTTTQPITRYQRQLKTAAANEWPREFDPVTGECLGRSVWESRTNLLLRSEEFNDGAWTKSDSTISGNQLIAPDGTLTADKLIASATTAAHEIVQSITPAAATYTLSFFAKAGEYRYIQCSNTLVGTQFINFDLVGGVVGSSSVYTGTITSVGNGWFRCTATVASAGGAFGQRISLITTLTAVRRESFLGDGYSGIYIWGAQLEAGAFATPYTPTVASQVTRLADSAVMTGTNFSSWFNPSEGAFFVEGRRDATSNVFPNLAVASDGTSNNRILISIYGGANQPAFDVVSGNATQCALTKTGVGAGVFAKVAGSYQTNSFIMTANGAAVETDVSGVVPVVNQLTIGASIGNIYTNGYIRRLTYYPQALTSANLQAITR